MQKPVDISEQAAQKPVITIRPGSRWMPVDLRELWEYRELFYFFTWRDVKVRYKQTLLGASWAILQPVLTMLVFSLFFGRLAGVPSDGIPYPVFSLAGLVPWTFFATSLQHASASLVANQNLVKKVYFPRLAVPAASVLSGLVDVVLAFGVLLVFLVFYGIVPTVNMLWTPVFIVLIFTTALGAGLWLSSLNVLYRDVQYVVPFLIQFWLFATPVAYPSSMLSEPWRTVYGLNPMAGIIEGFRWALLGTGPAPVAMLLASLGVIVLLSSGGLVYFRRMERMFADRV